MEWYKDCKLIETEEGYSVVVDIKMGDVEFSEEIMEEIRENLLSFDDQIRNFIEEKFSGVKINSVKFMVGSLIVASMPLMASHKVQAAETDTNISQIDVKSVVEIPLNTTGVVTASKLNMRSGAGTTYPVTHVLYQGNKVNVIGMYGDWYKLKLSDGGIGWVNKNYLSVNESELKVGAVLYYAKELIGTPYVWGGSSLQQGGFDCSGYTQYVYKQAGITLNRISRDQSKQGIEIGYANLKPGDLVFFSFEGNGNINHVGIYIGNGQMLHSPKTGDVVKQTDIRTDYWRSRFVTARRVI